MDYVVGFCFNSAFTHVTLIHKNRPEWQRGFLNGVGGKLEPEELPEDAMVREFGEETGVFTESEQWDYFAAWEITGKATIFFYYLADDAVFNLVKTTTDEAVTQIPVETLSRRLTVANLQYLIPLAIYAVQSKVQLPVVFGE